MAKRLTTKQRKFVNAIAETGHGVESAKRAYDIGSKGGSKTPEQAFKTASAIASENLDKPIIQEALDKLLEKLNFTKNDRIKILAEIANKQEDSRNRIGAIKEANRMTGAYPDDSLEVKEGEVKIVLSK